MNDGRKIYPGAMVKIKDVDGNLVEVTAKKAQEMRDGALDIELDEEEGRKLAALEAEAEAENKKIVEAAQRKKEVVAKKKSKGAEP